jgi:outer membrane protein
MVEPSSLPTFKKKKSTIHSYVGDPMKRWLLVVAVVEGMTLGVFAQTQSPQTAKVLTLDQAVKIALERNLSVVVARNTLDGQQSAVTAAYGGLLPTLTASGGWNRQDINRQYTTIQGGGILPISNRSISNSYSSSITSSIVLFNGFGNTSNVKRATANAIAAEQSLSRTRQSVVYQVQSLYLNLLRNEQLLRVSEDNLKRSRRQLEQIREANRVGSRSLADVYRQEVQVSNDELSLIQAQNNYDKAKADLVFALGLSVMDGYDFSDPSIKSEADTTEFKVLKEQYGDFGSLINQSLASRPDYLAAIENVNAASSAVTVARAGHFPSISGFANYNMSSPQFGNLRDNRTIIWGLSISFPIFNGWQTTNQVEQARVSLRNAEEQLSQAERQVQVDIQKSLLDLEAAMKQVDVTTKSVISATEDRRIAEEKYNLGAGTILDLLTANANYTLALSNKVNAAYNYVLVKKQLEYNLGKMQY